MRKVASKGFPLFLRENGSDSKSFDAKECVAHEFPYLFVTTACGDYS
jgi:hypothetical protein